MEDHRPLAARVAAACRTHGLLVPGELVLVGVSGGADSTALALLLARLADHGLPVELVLAHLDHGWRGPDEAAADLDAVRALATRVDAPLVAVPPPSESVRTEDAARRWRYHVLDRVARARGCAKVATGHHLRDQAETVLMRLERSSGRVGLRGIPVRRPLGEHGVEIVRPLLGIDPRELRAWLEEHGVGWREDPTNADLSRDRARARARLLAVEARGGSASRDLAAFAARLDERLTRDEARLEVTLGRRMRLHPQAAAVEVPRSALNSLSRPFLDLALRRMGREIGADRDGPFFTRRHVELLRGLLVDGGALDLPRSLHVDVAARRVWLRRRHVAASVPRLVWRVQDAAELDLEAFLARGVEGEAVAGEAVVDADVVGDAPTVRTVRRGDGFAPWGAEAERAVDVLAWLARRQVPAWLRARQPVVVGARGVAWVPGFRVDRRHAVTASTRRVALLALDWDG